MYRSWGKRTFDIVFSGIALFLLSPVMLIIVLAIWIEDGRPIFFRQNRVGQYGYPFQLIKFRSMPINTVHIPSAQAASLTITSIGRIIRRTNLDELPQLFNILSGEMSLVGPRPALASQEKLLSMRASNGAATCKPGLTGLAQINAYDGMPEQEKADWDRAYANSSSWLADIGIILKTFLYLLRKPPVY